MNGHDTDAVEEALLELRNRAAHAEALKRKYDSNPDDVAQAQKDKLKKEFVEIDKELKRLIQLDFRSMPLDKQKELSSKLETEDGELKEWVTGTTLDSRFRIVR